MRTERFGDHLCCVHCKGPEVQRWGFSASRRQRYKCRRCERTFSDLTATPAAYIKKILLWPAFCRSMEAGGESLRASARRLGIHVSTAFRWRQRLLAGLVDQDPETVAGCVAIGVLGSYPLSMKGQRGGLGRPARTRAPWPWAHPPHDTVGVAIATDAQDHVLTSVVGGPVLTGAEVEQLLGHSRLRGASNDQAPVLIVFNNILRPYERFLRTPWAPPGTTVYRRWNAPDWCSDLRGADRLRIYWLQLKRWMTRFRGVATRYLPRYLTWHRWLLHLLRHAAVPSPLQAFLRWAQFES